MYAGRNPSDQPQDGLGPCDILVESRIEHKDLGDLAYGEMTQLGLDPFQGEPPHAVLAAGVETEIATKAAPA